MGKREQTLRCLWSHWDLRLLAFPVYVLWGDIIYVYWESFRIRAELWNLKRQRLAPLLTPTQSPFVRPVKCHTEHRSVSTAINSAWAYWAEKICFEQAPPAGPVLHCNPPLQGQEIFERLLVTVRLCVSLFMEAIHTCSGANYWDWLYRLGNKAAWLSLKQMKHSVLTSSHLSLMGLFRPRGNTASGLDKYHIVLVVTSPASSAALGLVPAVVLSKPQLVWASVATHHPILHLEFLHCLFGDTTLELRFCSPGLSSCSFGLVLVFI